MPWPVFSHAAWHLELAQLCEEDHHRQRAGRARDHAGPAAENGGDQAHEEGRVKPHQRMHARHEGKRHRLRGDKRQRHRQPGQQLDAQPRGGEFLILHDGQIGPAKTLGEPAQKCGFHIHPLRVSRERGRVARGGPDDHYGGRDAAMHHADSLARTALLLGENTPG